MTDAAAAVAAYTSGLILMLGYAVYLWQRCAAIRAHAPRRKGRGAAGKEPSASDRRGDSG